MTNTKGTTMPQIDDAELFGNAEDQRAYEDFCANQEAVEKFTLDKPALVCRWRMSNKKVPMLNRHIRALSERLVQITPDGLSKVFYADNGSSGIEVALKMSHHYWINSGQPGKKRFITLTNSYHGETVAAMSVMWVSWVVSPWGTFHP